LYPGKEEREKLKKSRKVPNEIQEFKQFMEEMFFAWQKGVGEDFT